MTRRLLARLRRRFVWLRLPYARTDYKEVWNAVAFDEDEATTCVAGYTDRRLRHGRCRPGAPLAGGGSADRAQPRPRAIPNVRRGAGLEGRRSALDGGRILFGMSHELDVSARAALLDGEIEIRHVHVSLPVRGGNAEEMKSRARRQRRFGNRDLARNRMGFCAGGHPVSPESAQLDRPKHRHNRH